MVIRPTLEARFWAKVDKRGPDECWPWLAFKQRGYGRIGRGGRDSGMAIAHRVAYELFVGPIPQGLEIDHTCHDPKTCAGGPTCPHRSCVNPAHLEPVTTRENLMRGNTAAARHAAATHCPQGHPYSGANLRTDSDGHRRCKECRRLNQLNRRKALRALGVRRVA